MDLFEYAKSKTLDRESPLASVFVRRRWMKWSARNISLAKTNYYTVLSKPIS